MSQTTKTYAVRVTQRFSDLIQEFLARDTHINPSELLRDALREKIQREAPELFAQLFQEVSEWKRGLIAMTRD